MSSREHNFGTKLGLYIFLLAFVQGKLKVFLQILKEYRIIGRISSTLVNDARAIIVSIKVYMFFRGGGMYFNKLRTRQSITKLGQEKFEKQEFSLLSSQNMVRTRPYVLKCSGAPVFKDLVSTYKDPSY